MNYPLQEVLLYAILACAIGVFISFFIVRSLRIKRSNYDKLKDLLVHEQNERAQLSTRHEMLNKSHNEEKERHVQKAVALSQKEKENGELREQLATHSANYKALQQQQAAQKEEFDYLRIQSQLQFEKVANRLLEEKTEKFTAANKVNMDAILHPLQKKIKDFEEKIEKSNKDNNTQNASLKEMIKNYTDLSKKIGEDANNLTKALKGDFKQQGNWGEIILKTILDKSGLEENSQYFIQNTLRDAEGNIQRPDVIIELPDNKRLIVDSKVSLVAYDGMVAADTQEVAQQQLRNHSLAIKNHINGLSAKNYQDLYQVESPDFVIMFIPIDTAFSAALKHDPSLYEYAFGKNIIIVTASTLLATLKTVESLWKNDKQNRYALDIAAEAGKMYDKFVGFADDMEKMGSQLQTVQKTYDSSMKKLSNGTGNLVSRAEKIKALGANANKSIPQSLLKPS